ncbi:hypothetical protein YPPY72_4585, partial [Yersinia pestis PY-72]
MAGNERRG